MANKYQYEKIATTLDSLVFSREMLESLFSDLEFQLTEEDENEIKSRFVKNHLLISWMSYTPMSIKYYKNLSTTEYLTYNFDEYATHIKDAVASTSSSSIRNGFKNFTPYQWLNRINYYLIFLTSKIKPISKHLEEFFLDLENPKKFSLNSCPDYPVILQQTLTLSQFDRLVSNTINILELFFKETIKNTFLGQVGSNDTGKEDFIAENISTFKSRLYFDKIYTIKASENTANDEIGFQQFKTYIIPPLYKDDAISEDLYLQLQISSKQMNNGYIFNDFEFDDQTFDFRVYDENADEPSNLLSLVNSDSLLNIITIGDILFFLSIFIEKLSHIKHFNMQWKHLSNSIETELRILTVAKIEITDEVDIASHVSNVTVVISPIRKQKTLFDYETTPINEKTSTYSNTNILLVDSSDESSIEDDDISNLFDSLIYDNETTENIGKIENIIPANVNETYNTNGIFSSHYFIIRKNNFKLTLKDVQKQFNLYSGSIITKKTLLHAIDYIFSTWMAQMSTYTLQIITCHSNCHINIALLSTSIESTLNLTKTPKNQTCLYRDYCYCGSKLNGEMTIKKTIPTELTTEWNITKCEWSSNIKVTVTGGTKNYSSKPSRLKGIIKCYDSDDTDITTDAVSDSTTQIVGPSDILSFALSPYGKTKAVKITVRISDMDSACGVKEADYNANWIYTKQYQLAGTYTMEGTKLSGDSCCDDSCCDDSCSD